MPLLLWWGEEIDFSFVCIHMCSRICISFISSIDIVFVVVMVMYQDRQAMPPPPLPESQLLEFLQRARLDGG